MLRALDYNFVLSHKRGKQEESNITNFSFTFLVYVTRENQNGCNNKIEHKNQRTDNLGIAMYNCLKLNKLRSQNLRLAEISTKAL